MQRIILRFLFLNLIYNTFTVASATSPAYGICYSTWDAASHQIEAQMANLLIDTAKLLRHERSGPSVEVLNRIESAARALRNEIMRAKQILNTVQPSLLRDIDRCMKTKRTTGRRGPALIGYIAGLDK